MLFKDLKTGYNVYMLHRSDEIKIGQGKVTAISPSRLPQGASFQTLQMVVDVTIEEGGVARTYTIPDSLNVTYAGPDLVISTDREHVLKEVEAMKAHSESALAEVPFHEKSVSQCTAILEEWNPQYKEKRENEERFNKIESSIGDLKSMLSGLVKELKN